MADKEIRDRRRIKELKSVFRAYYGPTLPDDDAGRDALRLLAEHLVHLTGGRDRFLNYAETDATWATAPEMYEIWEAAGRALRKWDAQPLGQELNLAYDLRSFLGITTIAAADRTRAEVEALQRERKNARQRLKRAKQKRARAAALPGRFTARQQSLLNALQSGGDVQDEAQLRKSVGALACWRDRFGVTLTPESLRTLIRRELKVLIAAGEVIDAGKKPTRFHTEKCLYSLPPSGTVRDLVPAFRRSGSEEKLA